MRDFLESRFFKVVMAVCIISIGAFMYNLSTNNILPSTNVVGASFSKLQTAISNVGIFFSNVYSKSFEYEDLVQENRELKNQIRELESELRATDYISKENQNLKELLNISQVKPEYQFEIAEVIGRSMSSTQNVLTLDKGKKAGITQGDLVITQDGVVGVISSVGENHASVITVIDENFSMGGIATRSRELGILEGDMELSEQGYLKLSYLDKNSDVIAGDMIESSGVSGTYPKSLLIGTVIEVIIENQGVSKYALIEPFVDFSALNQVYIIKEF